LRLNKKGFSLLEVVLVIGIMGMLMMVLIPYFSTLNLSWVLFESGSDKIQNSRVAVDYFEREFTQAYKIISISESNDTLGYISFEKLDGTVVSLLADDSGSEIIFSLEDAGVYYEIAGPISELSFIGYDSSGAITDIPALIKSVELSFLLDQNIVSSNRYSKIVTLPKDILPATYYAVFATQIVRLKGTGTISGAVHTNYQLQELGSITVSGAKTDSNTTTAIVFPTVSINMLLNDYQDLSVYQALADHVLTGNQTFTSGNAYVGIYYISSGGTLTIQDGVVVSGSVIAESDVVFDGDNISIVPSVNMPAVVAGDDVHMYWTSNYLDIEGTVYANDNVFAFSNNININGNGKYSIAMAAKNYIVSLSTNLNFVGSVVSGADMSFTGFSDANITATSTLPACVAGGQIFFNILSNKFTINGIVYAYGNIYVNNSKFILNGSIMSNSNLRFGTGFFGNPNVQITYNSNNLKNPPIYMW